MGRARAWNSPGDYFVYCYDRIDLISSVGLRRLVAWQRFGLLHPHGMNEKPSKTISLTDEQRAALEAICRRRKVVALVLKPARASLLLASGYGSALVCEILI